MMAVIAWPISWILDRVLGEELGTIYSKQELSKLVDLTVKYKPHLMDLKTAAILQGALHLNKQKVDDLYTAMDDVFWVHEEETLSMETLTKIFKSGHSRIPVFRLSESKRGRPLCIGVLYTKDLILIDPDDNIPITQVLTSCSMFQHCHHDVSC